MRPPPRDIWLWSESNRKYFRRSLELVTDLHSDTALEIGHLASAHECDTDSTDLTVAHGDGLVTHVDTRIGGYDTDGEQVALHLEVHDLHGVESVLGEDPGSVQGQ